MEVSRLAQTSRAVASSTHGSFRTDSVDGTPDPQHTKAALAHLQQKILKLTEQIKIAQTAQDDNVAEYLTCLHCCRSVQVQNRHTGHAELRIRCTTT
uniref:Uncharacterized protein n=1 Tax=Neovison vison TaxID=452646 RepID=A0A8C7EUK4_NEOVI